MKNPMLKDLKQRNQKKKRMDRLKVNVHLWNLIYILMVGMLPSMGMSQLVVSSAYSGITISERVFWSVVYIEILLQTLLLIALYLFVKNSITNLKLTIHHTVFILSTVLIIIPLLSALSMNHMETFGATLAHEEISISSQASLGMISITPLPVSPAFFSSYLTVNLTISAFFGAFLIGLMQPWKASRRVICTILLIPTLIITAVGTFMLFNKIIAMLIQIG